jgi:hypothetical protein
MYSSIYYFAIPWTTLILHFFCNLRGSHSVSLHRRKLTASRSEYILQETGADTRKVSLYGEIRAARRGGPKAIHSCDDRRWYRHTIHHRRGFVCQGYDQAMISIGNVERLEVH